MAGVALVALGWLWWGAWSRVAPHFCLAVAIGGVDVAFVWQAWRLVTSTLLLRGRRGPYGAWLGLVARLVAKAWH